MVDWYKKQDYILTCITDMKPIRVEFIVYYIPNSKIVDKYHANITHDSQEISSCIDLSFSLSMILSAAILSSVLNIYWSNTCSLIYLLTNSSVHFFILFFHFFLINFFSIIPMHDFVFLLQSSLCFVFFYYSNEWIVCNNRCSELELPTHGPCFNAIGDNW